MRNQTGITADEITIANASDISGPVPGLFESAQEGVKAYVAYFNAKSDICGRKLKLLGLDSRTDAGGDKEAAIKGCESAFAMVGSISTADQGGAEASRECGIPDIRTQSLSTERMDSPNSFGVQSNRRGFVASAVPKYFAKRYPKAPEKAAFLYLDVEASVTANKDYMAAYRKNGYDIVYEQQISSSEFNYSPYVLEMQERGVKFVHFIGAYQQAARLAKAMDQQGFKPDAYALQPSAYDPRFLESGGASVEGAKIYTDSGLFEYPTPELRLYQQWLQQVAPGATPTYFGQFAWGAARLFVEKATALGGDLTRERMIAEMAKVRDYTANGMFAPQQVGAEMDPDCQVLLTVKGGRFVKESPGRFMCQGLTKTGVNSG